MMSSYLIFGIGNPVLDVVFEGDQALLDKFNLVENTAVIMGPEQSDIFSYLSMPNRPEIFYTPGGTVLNVIRGAQKLLKKNSTVFVGCVGNDKASQFLRIASERDGVKVEFQRERISTAKAAVIITNNNRTFCVELSAANLYSPSHLKGPTIWAYVEMCRIFYTDGFFLEKGMDSVRLLISHIADEMKVLAFNLAGVYVVRNNMDLMMEVLQYAKIVFGNADEARAFASVQGWETTDLKEIVTLIYNLPKANPGFRGGRIVAITDGPNDSTVYNPFTGLVVRFPVIETEKKNIIDTTGAGDAFAAGFLSQYVKLKPVEVCVRAGHYLAHLVIQNVGAVYGDTLPQDCPTEFIR